MRCPVCGAKLVAKQVCPYCKITDEQILSASNKKVKEYRKTGNKDLICYTNVIPSDLSRLKIILYTIFLGWLGINHLYVSRPVRGIYSIISTAGSFGMLIVGSLVTSYSDAGLIIYNIFYNVFFYMMAINVILWIIDIFASIFKTFKVPVVLPRKEKK
ncbi:MAG: hypothetical protein ACI4PF_04530 [Christensenellales bacterium]